MKTLKGKKRLWLLTLLCVSILAIAFKIHSTVSRGVTVSVVEVVKTSIQSYIDEKGRTSLPHIYHVTMPMQGRILPMLVTEGDRVEQGELVARLEDDDWRDAALEVKSIIKTFDNWLEASAAQLKAAKIRQEFDQWNWERNKKLAANAAISEREQRDAKRNYLDSNVQLESSEAMYFATKALQSIIDLLPGYVERNFTRTMLRSPVAGTVLKRHVWNEKVMTPGSSLLDIGNLEELEVTADILTEEAVTIQPGNPVEIYGASLGNSRLSGTVRIIEPEAFTKLSSLGVEEQRVTVKIRFTPEALKELDNKRLNLGLHYRVRCRIITKEKSNTLTIPRTALFMGSDSSWQLYRVEQNRALLTTVVVGLSNETEAEIVSGLKAGDTIITVPQSALTDGTPITPL